jgi:hypothetical protein
MLTDPVDIENALKERASQRREEEQLKHDENIQHQQLTKEEVEIKDETLERISEEVKRLPTGMTSNELISVDELRKMGMVIAPSRGEQTRGVTSGARQEFCGGFRRDCRVD